MVRRRRKTNWNGVKLIYGSKPDPFTVTEWPEGNPIGKGKLTQGRPIRDPRINPGERTGIFICAGQSNSASYVNVPYSPTNPAKIDNLNIYDGGTYAAIDPLLGCEAYSAFAIPGNMFLRVADKMISTGVFDRVILIPIGIGGSSVNLWNSRPFGDRLIVAFERARAVGLEVTAVLWQQGEADQAGGTTQAAYSASLSGVISRPRGMGFNAPWFIAKCSYFLGATSAAVIAAQTAIVNNTDIFAGANTDTITSGGRYDNGHFNATGANTAADLWVTALDGVF